MKRKFTFLFLFIGLIITKLFSQAYTPLPLQNCTLYYSLGSGTSNSSLMQTCLYNDNYKLYPNGDTIISGKRYIKMFQEWLSGSGGAISGPPCSPYAPPSPTLTLAYGLRQDTLAQKIYMLTFSSTNPETLMYDFNLIKKDTVKTAIADFGSIPPGGTTRYRIIDSVYYQSYSDGICRKTYKLKPFANSVGITAVDYFIEGYGTEAGPNCKVKYINQNFGGFGTGSMQSVSSTTLVVNTNTISAITNTCSQSLNISTFKKQDLIIYPNPAKEKITIDGLNNDPTIELINSLGEPQNFRLHKVGNTCEISLENISQGIYTLRLTSDEASHLKRIIKLD